MSCLLKTSTLRQAPCRLCCGTQQRHRLLHRLLGCGGRGLRRNSTQTTSTLLTPHAHKKATLQGATGSTCRSLTGRPSLLKEPATLLPAPHQAAAQLRRPAATDCFGHPKTFIHKLPQVSELNTSAQVRHRYAGADLRQLLYISAAWLDSCGKFLRRNFPHTNSVTINCDIGDMKDLTKAASVRTTVALMVPFFQPQWWQKFAPGTRTWTKQSLKSGWHTEGGDSMIGMQKQRNSAPPPAPPTTKTHKVC